MADIKKSLEDFKREGWEFNFDYISSPRGMCYSTEYFLPNGHGCPLCDDFLNFNPERETCCIHSREDEIEIEEARRFLGLARGVGDIYSRSS